MCCRTGIRPLVTDVAIELLELAGFKGYWKDEQTGLYISWVRNVEEEGTVLHATLRKGYDDPGELMFNIAPAISVFSQHYGKRITASMYFELAARYAEKVNGIVTQHANIVGCRSAEDKHATDLVVASYPEIPLHFDRICAGFQHELTRV